MSGSMYAAPYGSLKRGRDDGTSEKSGEQYRPNKALKTNLDSQNSENSLDGDTVDQAGSTTNLSISRHWHLSPKFTFSQQEQADQISWEDSPSMDEERPMNDSSITAKSKPLYLSLPGHKVNSQTPNARRQADSTALDAIMRLIAVPTIESPVKGVETNSSSLSNSNDSEEGNLFMNFDRPNAKLEPIRSKPTESDDHHFQALIQTIGSKSHASGSNSTSIPRIIDQASNKNVSGLPKSNDAVVKQQPSSSSAPLGIAINNIKAKPGIANINPRQPPLHVRISATSNIAKSTPYINQHESTPSGITPLSTIPKSDANSSASASYNSSQVTCFDPQQPALQPPGQNTSIISDEEMAFYEELERKAMEQMQQQALVPQLFGNNVNPSLSSLPILNASIPSSQVEIISVEEMEKLEELERQMLTQMQANEASPSQHIQSLPSSRQDPPILNNKYPYAPINHPHSISSYVQPIPERRPLLPINSTRYTAHKLPSTQIPSTSFPNRTFSGLSSPATQPVGESLSTETNVSGVSKTRKQSFESMNHYNRFYAIAVHDDYKARIKDITCVLHSDTVNSFDEALSSGSRSIVKLCGRWYSSDIAIGDVFHVISLRRTDVESFSSSPLKDIATPEALEFVTVVDDENGLLVLQPDTTLSPTRIVEACSCDRKAVIGELVRLFSPSYAAVLGNLKHSFVEELSLRGFSKLENHNPSNNVASLFDDSEKNEIIHTCISKLSLELLSVHCSDREAVKELEDIFEPTVHWMCSLYYNGVHSNSDIKHATLKEYIRMKSIEAVEENYYSPGLGMKGQIDMISKCEFRYMSDCNVIPFPIRQFQMPVEIKTGKWRPSTVIGHRAQVILYILMMLLRQLSDDNRTMEITRIGMLVYINPEDSEAKTSNDPNHRSRIEIINPQWCEIQALMITRNRLSIALKVFAGSSSANSPIMPPLLRSRDCEFCFQAAECLTYHAALENGDKNSVGCLTELMVYNTSHLSDSHKTFLKKWERLIDLEFAAAESRVRNRYVWGSSSLLGNNKVCVGGYEIISIDKTSSLESDENSNENDTVLELRKHHALIARDQDQVFSELDCEKIPSLLKQSKGIDVSVGDRIYISTELYSIRRMNSVHSVEDIEDIGKLNNCSPSALECVSIDSKIASGQILSIATDWSSIRVSLSRQQSINSRLIKCSATMNKRHGKMYFIRLDKDDAPSVGMSTLRSNVISLFSKPFIPNDFKLVRPLLTSKLPLLNKDEANMIIANDLPILSSTTANHLRDLVVDLVTPVFTTYPREAYIHFDQSNPLVNVIALLCPQNIPAYTFSKALVALNNFHQQRYSHLLRYLGYDDVLDLSTDGVSMSCGSGGVMRFQGDIAIYPGCNPWDLYEEYLTLNQGQKQAIHRVILAKDYALIIGLPGTGKSQTLSLLARIFIARQMRVLLTSYTHAAVDHLLLKLQSSGVTPSIALRLGSTESIDPSLHEYICPSDFSNNPHTKNVSSVSNYLSSIRLVACTVLTSASHVLFEMFSCDWAIVDEAGQISQPAVLGALKSCTSFVLVGDDYQLPPLIVSSEAQALGMSESLMKRLSEAHPQSMIALTAQYRMNADIMVLCNTLAYEGRMSCGSNTTALARLKLPSYHHFESYWLNTCLREDRSVVFLNTDLIVDSQAKTNQKQSISVLESEVVFRLVSAFQSCGCSLQDIGIISPFRAQVALLRSRLAGLRSREEKSVCEVSTVDKYQGRDKDVIVLSLVRGSEVSSAGDILRDWRRINVAITRAKTKLVIVGSARATEEIPALSSLIKVIRERNWLVDLPIDAVQTKEVEILRE